jgi:hypothetical protein
MTSTLTQSPVNHKTQWYHPTISPEHGVYVMLLLSFLTGAALSQQWTGLTTLTLICAYCGFQAEHPLSLQIKQRKSWKPRFLLWFGIYGGMAIALALFFLWQSPNPELLIIIYSLIALVTVINGFATFKRQKTSISNEIVAFAAVCAVVPLTYVVTTGSLSETAIALWLLNTVFFSSSIFSVKLRKVAQVSILSGWIFHAIAASLILILWQVHWLSSFTALAFGVAIVKYGLIVWQKDWYCETKIQNVAMIETLSSLLFWAIVTLSLLPAHLPT